MTLEVGTYLKFGRSPSVENKVAVVGGGVAGLSASIELANKDIPVDLYEKKDLETRGFYGAERSEMTHGDTLEQNGLTEVVTTPLNTVCFVNLDDPKKRFEHSLDLNSDATKNFAVGINHASLIEGLFKKAKEKGVRILSGVNVQSVEELEGNEGVRLSSRNSSESSTVYSNVVLAKGPSANGIGFPNSERERIYRNSIVCYAYGRRCRGRILIDNGGTAVIHPISISTGKTSWVCAGADGEIEIVASGYSRRDQIGKVPRKQMFENLKERLIEQGLVEIDEEGPIISGIFGLEGGYTTTTGWKRVFPHGEFAQFNKPTSGDAIKPSMDNSAVLASVISQGNSADEYIRRVSKNYNFALENAITGIRDRAQTVGGAMSLLEAVTQMKDDEIIKYLEEMKLPLRKMIPILLKDKGSLAFVSNLIVDAVKWKWKMNNTVFSSSRIISR